MIMEINENTPAVVLRHQPWNKGELIGQKPPLQPKHVWAIRSRLPLANKKRDLGLQCRHRQQLRGCDVVSLRVADIAPHSYALDRATIRQRNTGRPVRFELTEQTRQSVDDYLGTEQRVAGNYLFTGRQGERCLTTRQYVRLASDGIGSIGLDPSLFGTHSSRRTKATLIYRRTGNLRAVQLLLGHTKIGSTVRYLGVEADNALAISEQVDV
jgi:integrase